MDEDDDEYDGDAVSDEEVFRNVASLKKRLKETERNLQMLQTPRRHTTLPEADDDYFPRLSLRDLHKDESLSEVASITSSTRSSRKNASLPHRQRYTFQKYESGGAAAAYSSSALKENDLLRRKLHQLREENSFLVQENNKLISEVEDKDHALYNSKSQVLSLNKQLDTREGGVSSLHKRLDSLQKEVKSRDVNFRAAERELEVNVNKKQEFEKLLHESKNEHQKVRLELQEELRFRKRLEKQRDEVAQKLDELNKQMNVYSSKMEEKLKKCQETEQHLRDNLQHCDKEREELLERATALDEELQNQGEQMRNMEESQIKQETSQREVKELQAKLARVEEQATQLQAKLARVEEQTTQLQKEHDAKLKENSDLRDLTDHQSQRLTEYQDDVERSHMELKSLRDLTNQMQDRMRLSQRTSTVGSDSGLSTISHTMPHMRNTIQSVTPESLRRLSEVQESSRSSGSGEADDEDEQGQEKKSPRTAAAQQRMKDAIREAEVQRIQASKQRVSAGLIPEQGVMDGLRAELSAVIEKSKIGARKAEQLQSIINQLDQERGRHRLKLQGLQEEMEDLKEERESLERRFEMRDNQFRQLQRDLEEKSSLVQQLKQEVSSKDGEILSLESQLEKMSSEYTEHMKSTAETESNLSQKSTELAKTTETLGEKEVYLKECLESMEHNKQLNAEQCKELQTQVDVLQDEREAMEAKLTDFEKIKQRLKHEINEKTGRLDHLEANLQECLKELKKKDLEYESSRKTLQRQMDEGWGKVSQLETALGVCKGELALSIKQLHEDGEQHELEMATKLHEVLKLEKQLQHVVSDLEERARQISGMEKTLEDRQQMLQQSTIRIGELEEREGQLQQQVFNLEKELTKLRSVAMEETEAMDTKLQQVCQDLEEKVRLLKGTMTELSKTKEELNQHQITKKKSEQRLKETISQLRNQTQKTKDVEKEFRTCREELKQHKLILAQMEERLQAKEEELSDHHQQSANLDTQLHRAQVELHEASKQLTELQRLLQRSRSEVKQKHENIYQLNAELRQSQEELESKSKELEEMENILRASQRELDQRTDQVGQFDQAIKEHQKQQNKKIEDLEAQLQRSKEDLQNQLKQIALWERKSMEQQENLKSETRRNEELQEKCEAKIRELQQRNLEIQALTEKLKEVSKEFDERQRTQVEEQGSELSVCQRLLNEAQEEQDRLSKELDDTLQLCQNKDAECARLSEELGIAKVKEVKVQSHCSAEVRQVTRQQRLALEEREEKIGDLQNEHYKLRNTLEEQESSHKQEAKRLKDSESALKEQIQKLQEALMMTKQEGAAREEVLHAANEALVIKESEVARLNARISGYERAITTFGSPQSPFSYPSQWGSPLKLNMSPQRSSLRRSHSEVLLPSFHSDSDDPAPDMTPVRDSDQFSGLNPLKHSSAINSPYSNQILQNNHSMYYQQTFADIPRHTETQGFIPDDLSHSPFSISSASSGVQFAQLPTYRGISQPESGDFTDTTERESKKDSLDGLNVESFQSMLAYVNHKIAEEEKQLTHLQGQLEENRKLSHSRYLESTGSTPSPNNPDHPMDSELRDPSSLQRSMPFSGRTSLREFKPEGSLSKTSQQTLPFIASLLESGASPVDSHSAEESRTVHFPRGNDTLSYNHPQGAMASEDSEASPVTKKEKVKFPAQKSQPTKQKGASSKGVRPVSKSTIPKRTSSESTTSTRKTVSRQLFGGAAKGSTIPKKKDRKGVKR